MRGVFRSGTLVAAAVLAVAGCGGDEGTDEPIAEAEPFSYADFAVPPADAGPWVRWWWPGGDVSEHELRREVGVLKAAGFAGAEIQAFDAALDPNAPQGELARRRTYDSEGFYALLRAALDAAADEGLAIDLTLGSGWPSGGTHVAPEDSLKALVWSEHEVQGGAEVVWELDGPAKPAFYEVAAVAAAGGEPLARYLPEHAALVAVVAARVTGGSRSDDLLELTDQLELDAESARVITDHVDAGGTLRWDAPAGSWQVVALYSVPDGEVVSLSAEAGAAESAFVTDHFDASRVEATLEHLLGERTGLAAYYGAPLRGLFVDSFELKSERFFASDLLAEHQARRGYDITPLLPAVLVPGADNHIFDGAGLAADAPFRYGDDDGRLRADYQLTVSDLFRERLVGTAGAWAEARGLTTRVQPYGLNVDVIAAAGAAGIPEAEQLFAGGSELFERLVSSGAHLYGRPLVGAEAFVWAFRDHTTTPLRMKAAADLLFAAGINHLVYHGLPYKKPVVHTSPELSVYGRPGWHPFSSPFSGLGTYASHLGETSPFFEDLPELNAYVARCQHALRQGAPEADLLVYYPWLGFPASWARLPEAATEHGFAGRLDPEDDLDAANPLFGLVDQLFGEPAFDERVTWLAELLPMVDALRRRGYGWDWVDDASLRVAAADDGAISVRGRRYRALILYEVPDLPRDVAEALSALAGAGAPVLIVGDKPGRQRGYGDRQAGDTAVFTAMAGVLTADAGQEVSRVAADLGELPVEPGLSFGDEDHTLGHARRLLDDGSRIVFLHNRAREPAETTLTVVAGCPDPRWLDPRTGGYWSAGPEEGELRVELGELESRLLLCGAPAPEEEGAAPTELVAEASQTLAVGPWTLEDESAAEGTEPVSLNDLDDLRKLSPELATTAGPVVYRASIYLGGIPDAARAVLDLGRLEGAAELTFNGRSLGRLALPPVRVDVRSTLTVGANALEIRVFPPLRNHYTALGAAGEPGYAQFSGKKRTVPAGLLGPVQLVFGESP